MSEIPVKNSPGSGPGEPGPDGTPSDPNKWVARWARARNPAWRYSRNLRFEL